MKANNLTISIPGKCNFNCPYCVSNMTYGVQENERRFVENLHKTKRLAERMGVSHILITGKGEPFDSEHYLEQVLDVFYGDFPIEVQTHHHNFTATGKYFLLKKIDVLAISVDNPNLLSMEKDVWRSLSNDVLVRLTIILSKRFKDYRLPWFINKCHDLKINQLTIRQPTVPKRIREDEISLKTAQWIEDNADDNMYYLLGDQLDQMKGTGEAAFIRDLMFGATVWDINGVGFTSMQYCVESQNGEVMRSLIYQADGHLYTTWDHPGSIIF